MKITYLFSILLLTFSCSNTKIQPNANATQQVLLEYDCESSATISEAYDFLKEKINNAPNEVIVKEITLLSNPKQIEISIASVDNLDSFLAYLLKNTQVKFWNVYRPRKLPRFEKLLNDTLYNVFKAVDYDPNILLADASDTAFIHQILHENKKALPQDAAWRWGNFNEAQTSQKLQFFLIKKRSNPASQLSSIQIDEAKVMQNPQTGETEVAMRFNQKGTMNWGRMTTQAYNNNNNLIAITINESVVYAPKVMSPITGGQCMISNNFKAGEAEALANDLSFSALNFCEGRVVSIKNSK